MSERRFVLHNDFIRTNMIAYLGKLDLGTVMEVIVRPFIDKRSIDQNTRLWKLHSLVASATGNSAEDMHEEALCRFFGYREVTMPTGWIKRVPLERSSAKNKKRFGEFMESTEAWYIQDFGVWLDQREAA